MNVLLDNKELLLTDSSFGLHEILFFNPVTEEGFVLETAGNSSFILRNMSKDEFMHSKKVLDKNSLYSQESIGKTRLVINFCRDCVLAKFREYSTSPNFLALVSEEWMAALAFHEHMHAFDQKNWRNVYSKYPDDCYVKIQEGSAYLAEARAYSLLTFGNTSKVRDYFDSFASVRDQTSIGVYLLPALRFLAYESKTGESYFNGLVTGKVDPCEG